MSEQIDGNAGNILQLAGGLGPSLGKLPGLAFIDKRIGPVGSLHDDPHRSCEVACLVCCCDLVSLSSSAGKQPAIVWIHRRETTVGQPADGAAGEVDDLAHDVGVGLGEKIVEIEIDVVDAAGDLGGIEVAKHLCVDMLKPRACQDEGAPALGHFLAVDRQEAMHMHGLRQPQASSFEHRRPEEGVEVGDVFADEVMDLNGSRIVSWPPPGVKRFAVGVGPLGRGRDVSDRGVKPDIPVVAWEVGNLKAEVGCRPGDIPVAEGLTEKVAGKVVGDRCSQCPGSLGPFLQEVVLLFQLNKKVFGRPHLRWAARERAAGVDQVSRAAGRAAGLAGVAILIGCTAPWAGAFDESVGEKDSCLWIKQLLHLTTDHKARCSQLLPDLSAEPSVGRAVG